MWRRQTDDCLEISHVTENCWPWKQPSFVYDKECRWSVWLLRRCCSVFSVVIGSHWVSGPGAGPAGQKNGPRPAWLLIRSRRISCPQQVSSWRLRYVREMRYYIRWKHTQIQALEANHQRLTCKLPKCHCIDRIIKKLARLMIRASLGLHQKYVCPPWRHGILLEVDFATLIPKRKISAPVRLTLWQVQLNVNISRCWLLMMFLKRIIIYFIGIPHQQVPSRIPILNDTFILAHFCCVKCKYAMLTYSKQAYLIVHTYMNTMVC